MCFCLFFLSQSGTIAVAGHRFPNVLCQHDSFRLFKWYTLILTNKFISLVDDESEESIPITKCYITVSCHVFHNTITFLISELFRSDIIRIVVFILLKCIEWHVALHRSTPYPSPRHIRLHMQSGWKQEQTNISRYGGFNLEHCLSFKLLRMRYISHAVFDTAASDTADM